MVRHDRERECYQVKNAGQDQQDRGELEIGLHLCAPSLSW